MNDFYCDEIISKKTKVDIVYETEEILAFHHTKPYFELHIVIIPKKHIDSLSTFNNNSALSIEFLKAISYVTKLVESEYGGCRVSSNVGDYQSTKHLHWYVHHGKRLRNEDGSLISKISKI